MKVTVWLTHTDILLVSLQILVEFLSALTLMFLNNTPLSEAVHLSNKREHCICIVAGFLNDTGIQSLLIQKALN
jgi:hypothetical protein